MSTEPTAADPVWDPLLLDYQTKAASNDELLRLKEDAQLSWIVRSLASGGRTGLLTRDRMLRRLVREDDVTYGGALDGRKAKRWAVDLLPVIINSDEWQWLRTGLQQRYELLDELIKDFYGPRHLLHDKVIPASVVLGHRGYLLVADQISLPTDRQLILTATDLVRASNDQWTVLSDRVQAPSGVGYALANRRLISRVLDVTYRCVPIHRLRGYFDLMRAAIIDAAPADVEQPRVALLSAGPGSETVFDQALVASLLGHPLVQASDLAVKGGKLYLRTTGRLQQIDVVQRRVDPEWVDSLDLRPDSRLGAAGMVEAARNRHLSIINGLGSAVLENPGLLAYLDAAARVVLGSELQIGSAQTWWCGEPSGLSHALAHLNELVIKPIARGEETTRLGWQLSNQERDELAAKLKAQPWLWAVQEPVTASTAPVVTNTGLQPRRLVLRTFGTAYNSDYHILPGGLARVAPDQDSWVITNANGALAKDVWVLDTEEAAGVPVSLRRSRAFAMEPVLPGLPTSSADNLYWLGRYVERTEATARLINMASQAVEDNHHQTNTPGYQAMTALLNALSTVTSIPRPLQDTQDADLHWLERVTLDEDLDGSLQRNSNRSLAAANNVRELLSADTSSVLAIMVKTLRDASNHSDDEVMHIQPLAAGVLHSTLAFAGLGAESLVRDPTWAFQEAGRRMERAQTVVRLLSSTLTAVRSPVAEALLVESVLRACDSLITYERRMAAGVGPSQPAQAALNLLLKDSSNPRSVQYQLDRLVEAFDLAQDEPNLPEAKALAKLVRQAEANVQESSDRSPVNELLHELDRRLRVLSDDFSRTHFKPLPQQSLALLERVG